MENPTIYLFGIRIDEPVTTATDLLVAFISFYAWYKLRQYPSNKSEITFFKTFFFLIGIATFLGGLIGHGFLYALSPEWKLPGWLVSMASITTLERAVIFHTRPILNKPTIRFFYWFNVLELLTFATLAYGFLNFRFVEIHTAYGLMVVVLGFCIFNIVKGRNTKAVRNLIAGVFYAVLAAVFFTARVSISEWFNYFDISHIFMAGTGIMFYRAAREIAIEQA